MYSSGGMLTRLTCNSFYRKSIVPQVKSECVVNGRAFSTNLNPTKPPVKEDEVESIDAIRRRLESPKKLSDMKVKMKLPDRCISRAYAELNEELNYKKPTTKHVPLANREQILNNIKETAELVLKNRTPRRKRKIDSVQQKVYTMKRKALAKQFRSAKSNRQPYRKSHT